MKYLALVALLGWALTSNALAQESDETTHFGAINLSVGTEVAQTYYAHNALLYNNVEIVYDTTLNLQSESGTKYFFYPQLRQGTQHVLHILLAEESDARNASKNYLDVYFMLGDTLTDEIVLSNTDSTAFLFKDGALAPQMIYANEHNARFNLIRTDSKSGVTGKFESAFIYAFDGAVPAQIKIAGDLAIPNVNLRSGQETGIAARKGVMSEDNRKRNLVFAGMISALILVGIAFR
ncbi:MAG: hypothetical protein ACRBF0_07450 [Calditrichia bacterium]